MEWVVKKYKINKQTTYLLLYYQEINMVHKQKKNKEKMRKKKLLLHGKSKTNLLTLTNKNKKKITKTLTHSQQTKRKQKTPNAATRGGQRQRHLFSHNTHSH
uniref:(northern house mosquito) hypothetical protein n=1 Tax=Culex pipiens TaxID=7175 RepID=A0A8D8A429_CULPI